MILNNNSFFYNSLWRIWSVYVKYKVVEIKMDYCKESWYESLYADVDCLISKIRLNTMDQSNILSRIIYSKNHKFLSLSSVFQTTCMYSMIDLSAMLYIPRDYSFITNIIYPMRDTIIVDDDDTDHLSIRENDWDFSFFFML